MRIIENAIVELDRCMKQAASREEYLSASDFQRVKERLQMPTEIMFTEKQITDLQSEVHQIVGDGQVMQCFNKLLGIQAG